MIIRSKIPDLYRITKLYLYNHLVGSQCTKKKANKIFWIPNLVWIDEKNVDI